MQQPAVDFIINVFERSYRDVLVPGFVRERSAQHRYPFQRRTILVNNVDDRADVEARLAPLVASGEITDYAYVADHIDQALARAGLTARQISPTRHYTNCSLVAVFLPGSPYLVYNDADVFLETPFDWVTPSLQLMASDPRIAVANPNWQHSSLAQETRESRDGFGIGYGFSDQLYLLRRAEFQAPIYRHIAPASWRYPMSYRSPIFEQRVDAYMRAKRRLRATLEAVTYTHGSDEGVAYRNLRPMEKIKRTWMQGTRRLLEHLPGDDPRLHC